MPDGPVWRFLIQPRWLGWHLLMVVSFWGMLWLGDWQFHRALAGNALSWAYTFEWPLFAGLRRGLLGQDDPGRVPDPAGRDARSPGGRRRGGAPAGRRDRVHAGQFRAGRRGSPDEDEDEELSAYNAYLARLNAEVKGHGRRHGLR